jgi:quinolinate synthase
LNWTQIKLQEDEPMKFSPCTGKCTEEGTHCEGCGRTHEEIAAMREPVGMLVDLAHKMQYENIEDFARAVGDSIKYKMGLEH